MTAGVAVSKPTTSSMPASFGSAMLNPFEVIPTTTTFAAIPRADRPSVRFASGVEGTRSLARWNGTEFLPVNTGSTPIIQARASLKWDISPILSTIAWVQYVRDNNATFVERDPSEGTVALRTFVEPDFDTDIFVGFHDE